MGPSDLRCSADDAPKAGPALIPVQGGEEEIQGTAVGNKTEIWKFFCCPRGRILNSLEEDPEEDGDLSVGSSQASCLPADFRPWLEGIFQKKIKCKSLNTTFLILLWEGRDPRGSWV